MENYEFYEEELYHHGIKGMRWGIRRYQNKDGSLTPAGKKRQAKLEDNERAKAESKARRKPISKMSNDELKSRMDRMQLEKDYASLLADTSKHSKGKKFVMEVLEKAGKDVLTQTIAYAGGVAVNKYLFKGVDAIDPKNIQNRRKK